MKLPNDIQEALTKELLDELHEDLIHFCLNCNADITAKEMFCSSECAQADLQRRWKQSNVYKIEQEKVDLDQVYINQIKLSRKNNFNKRQGK